jgi:hypothetical protein
VSGDLTALEAAALGTLIGGAIALVGIIVRERALDRHRFTDRKQTLYADVWIGCDRHRQQVADQVAWRSADYGTKAVKSAARRSTRSHRRSTASGFTTSR